MPLTPDDIEGLRILGYVVNPTRDNQFDWGYQKIPHTKVRWSAGKYATESEAWAGVFADATERGIVTPIGSRDSAQESDANN